MNLSDLLSRLVSDPAYLDITYRLTAALAVGGLIGLERSYHGRPAGFRTHALVCCLTAEVSVREFRIAPSGD